MAYGRVTYEAGAGQVVEKEGRSLSIILLYDIHMYFSLLCLKCQLVLKHHVSTAVNVNRVSAVVETILSIVPVAEMLVVSTIGV